MPSRLNREVYSGALEAEAEDQNMSVLASPSRHPKQNLLEQEEQQPHGEERSATADQYGVERPDRRAKCAALPVSCVSLRCAVVKSGCATCDLDRIFFICFSSLKRAKDWKKSKKHDSECECLKQHGRERADGKLNRLVLCDGRCAMEGCQAMPSCGGPAEIGAW